MTGGKAVIATVTAKDTCCTSVVEIYKGLDYTKLHEIISCAYALKEKLGFYRALCPHRIVFKTSTGDLFQRTQSSFALSVNRYLLNCYST